MQDKPLVWLKGQVKTPPLSASARVNVGVMLRRLQRGEKLTWPHSRSMPSIGRRCHELRFEDAGRTWRIIYRVDADVVIIGDVFEKKSAATPRRVIEGCRNRFKRYDQTVRGA